MQHKIENVKKKSKQVQFRISSEFIKQIDEWLELHPQYDFSKLVRKAIEEKITQDGTLTKEINPLELKIEEKFNEMQKNMARMFEGMGKALKLRKESDKVGVSDIRKFMDTDKDSAGEKETKTSNNQK